MSIGRVATRNFIVGLFMLTGLGAVAYLSLSVGGFSLNEAETIKLYAAFDETGGLKKRAKVTISGVTVGSITAITLNEFQEAWVEMTLDANLEYSADTTASIMTDGLLGDRYILLQLGGDPTALTDGEEFTWTESALLLERLIGKLVHNTDVGG